MQVTKGSFVYLGLDVAAIISNAYPCFIPAWRQAGSANVILPGSSFKLRLLVINLVPIAIGIPGRQMVNFPTASNVSRYTITQFTNVTIYKIIQADSFTNFIKSARDFCDFIENEKTEKYVTFLQLMQTHLQSLYFGGQKLQLVDLNYNLDFEDIMTKPELEKVLNGLADRLNDRFYWHIFDPTKEGDINPCCGDLLDDLSDIYKDLKNLLLLYDKGTPAEIESAVWSFKWSFDNHWGDHCINATYALHYFIQSLS